MPSSEEICRLFYEGEFIPLFVYRDGAFSAQFPETSLAVQPPAYILRALQSEANDAAMRYSDANCLYFSVRATDGAVVFGGPVPGIWVDDDTLIALRREYVVTSTEQSAFDDYMARIPPYNPNILGRKLSLLHFLLTGTLSDPVLPDSILAASAAFTPSSEQAEQLLATHEAETYNNSYEIEALLQRFVTEGDAEGFEEFVRNVPPFNPGTVASTGLRALKDNLIVSVALACRAAIAAGIPRETAYSLSDAYIREMERLQRADELLALNVAMLRDFIARVRTRKETLLPSNAVHNRLMHRCVNYIHRNLNHRITIEDVAAHVNLSRSYLSTTFRQCMGVSMNRYILDAKLEEAASLLRYTDRPIADIAEYLCFSSQSHFQQVFKDKFSQTPRTYRASFTAETQ
ncbi:MAG: AraC family transcriptional regulator [Clostridia bacterium]|nr:AraC family transcriptional regulator [Clostridia bacterium]